MYDRALAISYAYEWWNKRNPEFYNFDSLGGDCTNFVSQCLYFGGINMNYSHLGWFYKNLNWRSPSWAGVEEFYSFSISNHSNFGVKTKLCTIEELEIGDIVQLKLINENRYHHTMLVTKILEPKSTKNIFVTCHTYDAKDASLSNYNISEKRFLKVIN